MYIWTFQCIHIHSCWQCIERLYLELENPRLLLAGEHTHPRYWSFLHGARWVPKPHCCWLLLAGERAHSHYWSIHRAWSVLWKFLPPIGRRACKSVLTIGFLLETPQSVHELRKFRLPAGKLPENSYSFRFFAVGYYFTIPHFLFESYSISILVSKFADFLLYSRSIISYWAILKK